MKAERCDGCRSLLTGRLTMYDNEGVPLCAACMADTIEDNERWIQEDAEEVVSRMLSWVGGAK